MAWPDVVTGRRVVYAAMAVWAVVSAAAAQTGAEVVRVRPVTPSDATHAVFGPAGLVLTIALGEVPAHSPYQPGDWVRLHGFRGYPNGPLRWGWRGYVTGGMGSTLLRGITDDGREWCEYWGALDPDGTTINDGGRCTCCPTGERWRRRPRTRHEQPALFNALALLGGGGRG